MGASEGNEDCLESSPRKIGSKWFVNLRPSKLDRDEDQTWNDLAETTFNMYFKAFLMHGMNSETMGMNTMVRMNKMVTKMMKPLMNPGGSRYLEQAMPDSHDEVTDESGSSKKAKLSSQKRT